MNPAYLHEPITIAKQVEAILKSKAVENQHFEWKGDWWEDSDDETAAEEAAKDVSSMLNGDGGTILVGIDQDKQSRASQPFFRAGSDGQPDRVFKLGKRQMQLEDWLHSRLEPSEARTFVDMRAIKLERDGKTWNVLAVNVAPYPHGAVAAVYRQSKDLYRFVVREGEHAREMAWEEVVRRNEAGNRAMYLRLRAIQGESGRMPIAIASPLEVRVGAWCERFTVPCPDKHGDLVSVAPDTVALALTAQGLLGEIASEAYQRWARDRVLQGLAESFGDPAWYATQFFEATGIARDPTHHVQAECKLTVPTSMIRAAWPDSDKVLNFSLDGVLVWRPRRGRVAAGFFLGDYR